MGKAAKYGEMMMGDYMTARARRKRRASQKLELLRTVVAHNKIKLHAAGREVKSFSTQGALREAIFRCRAGHGLRNFGHLIGTSHQRRIL
jgi:hypothetical protein